MFDREIRSWQKNGALTALHLIGPGDQKFDRRSARLTRRISGRGETSWRVAVGGSFALALSSAVCPDQRDH